MATTDVGTVHHQKVRASWGKDAKETSDVKYAVINATASGDNTIVAAVSGKVVRVISYLLIANGTVTATWKQGATNISGPLPLVVNAGACAPEATRGWMETASNAALILNLSSAVTVGGHISYVEEA